MRGWLYSIENPEGEIFDGESYSAHVLKGWVDTPEKVGVAQPMKTNEEPKPKGKPGRKPKAAL